jgi:hypothetical protein
MRFQDRIIGTRRNYEAEQAGHKVERLIRIPRADQVERGAFVVISGKQYGIAQTQIIKDTLPECTDLTLEQPELLLDFDDTEVGGGGRDAKDIRQRRGRSRGRSCREVCKGTC